MRVVLLAPLSPFRFNFYLLCCVLSFDVIVKRCEAANAWVVSGATEISIYHYHYQEEEEEEERSGSARDP